MTTFISSAEVERALDAYEAADRDRIVLSGTEIAMAYEDAITTPRHVMSFFADCAEQGREVSPRVRARYVYAQKLVTLHGFGSFVDEPVVSHSTVVKRHLLSPVVGRDEHGNKVVEVDSSTAGFRVAFVEREDGSDVHPMVTCDIDAEYDERGFAVMVAHLAELVREMDPTGSLRFAGEQAVQR